MKCQAALAGQMLILAPGMARALAAEEEGGMLVTVHQERSATPRKGPG